MMETNWDSLQRIMEIAELRSKGIQDTHFLDWTFQIAEDNPYVQMAKRYVDQWSRPRQRTLVFCFGVMWEPENPSSPPALQTHFFLRAFPFL